MGITGADTVQKGKLCTFVVKIHLEENSAWCGGVTKSNKAAKELQYREQDIEFSVLNVI